MIKNLVKSVIAMTLSIGICAATPMPANAQTQPKVVTIGQKKNADYSFKIKNGLKETIKGLRIKTSEEETFRANELKKKQSIKKNKYVKFNYQLFEGETDDTAFMLRIELKNGKIYTLTNFPMSAIHNQVSIKKKDGIVYLRYQNADGEYVSTFEQEKAALTTTNDDDTEETVDTNETDKEEAEASQSDEQNISGSDAMTSQPVTIIQDYNNSQTTDSSDEVQNETTDTQQSTDQNQDQTTTDQNGSKQVTPYGGACSTAESCQKMRDEYQSEMQQSQSSSQASL